MGREQLLAEIEDIIIIKVEPPRATIRHETTENAQWFGRVRAAVEKCNPSKSALANEYLDLFFSNGLPRVTGHGLIKLRSLLHQAQAELRLETAPAHGPPGNAVRSPDFDTVTESLHPSEGMGQNVSMPDASRWDKIRLLGEGGQGRVSLVRSPARSPRKGKSADTTLHRKYWGELNRIL